MAADGSALPRGERLWYRCHVLGEEEKHLLSGLDDRRRGFSRQVEISSVEDRFCSALQYEKLSLTSSGLATKEDALLWIVQALHSRGYRQLRSRLSFRGGTYFGSLEAWIEYPDPEEKTEPPRNFRQKLRGLWKHLFH
jgi:hypothetical protein